MDKITRLVLLTHAAAGFALTPAPAQTPTPTPAQPTAMPLRDKLTQVLPDGRVTFRLLAPNANAVDVIVGIKSGPYETQGSTTAAMAKDANGLWSVTLGSLEPNLYAYQFSLDGRKIADPGNGMPKPQRQVDTSLLLISGMPPDFLDVQNCAHGTTRDETYYSTTLGKHRRVLVYTPPTYDRSHAPLPVLYLYHGFWDTRYSWVTEGRIGAFSPGVRPAALSEEFKSALMEPDKINKTLLLFDIISGDDDKIVGEDVTKFQDQLKQANVRHVYTLLPGGTHSMFVWRPALDSFLQQIFKQ
jgi:enterochelin esterase-like enzyme